MANPSIQYWDEWQGINKILTGLDIPTWDPVDLRFDIDTHHYLPRIMYQDVKAPILFWEAGSLHVMDRDGCTREGIYLHLQKRPMKVPRGLIDVPRFYISGNRFTAEYEPRASLIKDAIGSMQFRM